MNQSESAKPQKKINRGLPSGRILREIVKRFVKAVHPQRIILFGSAARGQMGPDSDLDLLVVKKGAHRRRTAQKLYLSKIGMGVPMDILVARPEDLETGLKKPGWIYSPALREGRVLYASTKA